MSDPTLVGIDVGGTVTRVGVCGSDGEPLAEAKAPTAEVTATRDIDRLTGLMSGALEVASRPAPTSVGAGVTGQISADGGVIDNPYTLPGWHELALGDELSERWGVTVAVENDVDAAALGEYWQGAGRGQSRLFVIAIGTGIGTGFIVDGRIYRGARGLHPEAGHQIVDPTGPPCFCGANGCLEVMASGTAIERMAAERMGLGASQRLDGSAVAEAARAGDEVASGIFAEAARYLGVGLINVMTTLAPTRILVGGGIAEAWDLLGNQLREALRGTEPLFPRSGVEVMPCALGGRSGVLGAAYAGLKRRTGDT